MHTKRIEYFNSLSDRELVAMLLANDKEAIEYVFFYRCNGMFAHIINSVFKTQGKKEELITELYLYLSDNDWKLLRMFEFRSGLNTWLTVVAVRFFKKKHFSQTKIVVTEPQILVETRKDESDDFNVIDEMSRIDLYKAIDKLEKPRERYALLAELSGKDAEEIAADMQCTVSAVYNLTKKARAALKNFFNGRQ